MPLFSSCFPTLCLMLMLPVCLCDGPVVIHVSTTGNDENDGSSHAPLRTFGAAQSKARSYDAFTAVTVQFEEGLYQLSQTQLLTQKDSGTSGAPRVYRSAPGAKVTITGDSAVTGWRAVQRTDAAWEFLDEDARANVMVAPVPHTKELPHMLYDAAAESASPADRAVRLLPNTNVVFALIGEPRQDSKACSYLGTFKSENFCRNAALRRAEVWGYAWHDPAKFGDDWAGACYGRRDFHGGRNFHAQDGVMAGVFATSNGWREITDWDISASVATQHRCPGAECEYFDSEENKSTMNVSLEQLENLIGNDASSLSLRIYFVEFAMNVLPIKSVTSSKSKRVSTVRTAYAGTLRLVQKPVYCDNDYNEGSCSPSVWLLNTMKFEVPGQFAINTKERTVYYWPALASKNVDGVSVPAFTTLINLHSSSKQPVAHVSFVGLNFAHGNRVPLQRGDAGGIQHDWALLQSNNALVTLSGVSDVTIRSCSFSNSGGGGLRADGFVQRVNITSNVFKNLGYEAVGIYGLGLGLEQVTVNNSIVSNDISSTGLVKFDSPAVAVWNAARTAVLHNFIHDTSSRALYLGGSRYCTKPKGFATDGGIRMNQWDELTDANIPKSWINTCQEGAFIEDCKCSFFRGAHGNVIQNNIFARVTERKDSPFFSDGIVYISGPGYVERQADVTVFEDNTYLASPAEGAPAMRMLYIDGYTGSVRISRNAVVNGNSLQGFNLCNWYGESPAQANVLELGDASWGSSFDISCDGNTLEPPLVTLRGNLVLSDESSSSHKPDTHLVDQYIQVFETVCAASLRAEAPSQNFLKSLNTIIIRFGGPSRKCDAFLAQTVVLV